MVMDYGLVLVTLSHSIGDASLCLWKQVTASRDSRCLCCISVSSFQELLLQGRNDLSLPLAYATPTSAKKSDLVQLSFICL